MYVSLFFSGALFCNAIPHLVSGLCGLPFPTPFARPPGVGRSNPLVNFLWGFLNVLLGLYLFTLHPIHGFARTPLIAFFAGALPIGVYLSTHFGKVQKKSSQQ